MAKGDGSITPARNKKGEVIKGRWRVALCFGRDPITGKQNRVVRIVKGTKAEVRKVRDQIRREHEQGLKFNQDLTTFSEMCKLWTFSRHGNGIASETTIALDAQRLTHIEAYIGHIPLRNLDVATVEKAFADIRADRGISGSTLNKLFGIVKRVFAKAVDYDLISRNPCDKLKAPKKNDPDRKSLKADEAARLLRVLDAYESASVSELEGKEERQAERGNTTSRCRVQGLSNISGIMAVRIGLATGMRRGEVLGLMWKDVDFDEVCEIHVRRSYTPALKLKEPKTKAGFRTIALDAATTGHLMRWKQLQADCLSTLGEAFVQTGDTPVCCTDVGGLFDPTNFYRWWDMFRKDNGFATLKFHELRHTQATQLLANGVDVKTVQTRLGHANASITLNWYAHSVPENDRKAAQIIGDLFGTIEDEASEETCSEDVS